MIDLSEQIIQKFFCANILIFVILALIPAIRVLLGIIGTSICSFGLSLHLAWVLPNLSYLEAARTGVSICIPILISYELITAAAKSLEILRGSQMAEQLFVQERGGPIEFFLFLLVGSIFLSNGGAESIILRIINHSTYGLLSGDQLQNGYYFALNNVFPLAGFGIVLELISGFLQRVSRKGYLGTEISNLRVPLSIFFLVSLLEEVI